MFKLVTLTTAVSVMGVEWPCNKVAPVASYTQATCEAECQAAKSMCDRHGYKSNDDLFTCISHNTNVARCVYHTSAHSSDAPVETPWYKKPVAIGSASAGIALIAGMAGYGFYKRQQTVRSTPVDETTALSEGAYYNKNGVLVDANGNAINVSSTTDAF